MKTMKLTFLFTALLCVMGMSFAYAGEKKKNDNIKILLQKDVKEALIEAKGGYVVSDPKDGSRVTSSSSGKRYVIRPTTTGIKWGEEYVGTHQIHISPKSRNDAIIVNGIEYNGGMVIYKVGSKLTIVNDVAVDAYIKSILSVQFPYPLENEVMSAIAIAARTSAHFQIEKNKEAFWHIDAGEVNYQGKAVILADSHITQAVDKTHHLILLNSSQGTETPFAALWTENSAGKTAPYHAIFRKDFYAPQKGVDAIFASLEKDSSKWTYSISCDKLAQILQSADIKEIKQYIDSSSGKTYGLQVVSSTDSKDIDFFTFQKALGTEKILSNDFAIRVKDGNALFTGYGKGHGVGICIHSASSMAQNGDNAVKILSKFFPETYIVNLSAMPEKTAKK